VKNSSGRQKTITAVIRSYVPNVRKEPRVGAELNYLLPHESSPVFEQLFDALQQNSAKLGIDSFGASVTTMEEVFIKYSYTDIAKFARHLPRRYGNSHATWDHTVLPATRQR